MDTDSDYQSITFTFDSNGDIIFPWWNPLAQEIIDALGAKMIDDQGSIFCG